MNISTMFLLLRNSSDCCLFVFASLPHMSICTRIIIAVAFQKIDDAPNAKTTAKRRNKRLKNIDRRIKKLHI